MDHRVLGLILKAVGVLLLLGGVFVGFFGPVEMYCFYLFSEGGRFSYEGFGFGSFMFANIAVQIVGYYLIAAVAIPLGYGHLKLRRWARTLTIALTWFWLVTGIPLAVIFMGILITSKELTLLTVLAAMVVVGFVVLLAPVLLLWFYRGQNVRRTFEVGDPTPNPLEALPMPLLVTCVLYLFFTVAMHVPIFFNGAFPLMGFFVYDLPGFVLLDLSIWLLLGLTWGAARRRIWAWWGGVVVFGFLTCSWIITLVRSSLSDILSHMLFAPTEMEALQGVPLQGCHLAALIGPSFLITWGLIIASKRFYRRLVTPD